MVSFTAQLMALQRAFEAAWPARRRVVEDPVARTFLSSPLRAVAELARLPVVGRALPRLYDAIWPGPRASAVARTRVVDDAVRDAVGRGVSQVAILGAGFDSRAWRMSELAGARVFEVDRADTQHEKRRALGRHLVGDRVVFVPLDFERDDLAEALRSAGFAADAPALFLWEGVTNYLHAPAIDATLRALRALAPPGGELVFTYVHRGSIDGTVHFPEAARWMRGVAGVGEPWTFGWDPVELDGYLAARGWRLVWDVSTAHAGAQIFSRLGRTDRASELYRIAACRV